MTNPHWRKKISLWPNKTFSSPQEHWSVSSDPESSMKVNFWRYGSDNPLKSNSSSRDSRDEAKQLAAGNSGNKAAGNYEAADVSISVPYRNISDD